MTTTWADSTASMIVCRSFQAGSCFLWSSIFRYSAWSTFWKNLCRILSFSSRILNSLFLGRSEPLFRSSLFGASPFSRPDPTPSEFDELLFLSTELFVELGKNASSKLKGTSGPEATRSISLWFSSKLTSANIEGKKSCDNNLASCISLKKDKYHWRLEILRLHTFILFIIFLFRENDKTTISFQGKLREISAKLRIIFHSSLSVRTFWCTLAADYFTTTLGIWVNIKVITKTEWKHKTTSDYIIHDPLKRRSLYLFLLLLNI